MKRFTLMLLFAGIILSQDMPFTKGVNLTGWLQAGTPQTIQFTKFTREDFEDIKSLGADVIRLPVNMHFMTNGAPDYLFDPLFLSFLDQAVDWAEELQISLILDNHTFDPSVDTDTSISAILIPVWQQLAERYKNRSKYIYYEILNEPHGISDSKWNEIQLEALNAIRAIDTVHTIVVGGAGWNSYNNLKSIPVYSDTNLIYTFHFYDPFIFTHQGAGWTDPSMEPLAGVPFPFNINKMPEFPSSLAGTWIQSSFNNYVNDGTLNKVKSLIDIAAKFAADRNVKVFCGEFGVLNSNSPDSDRTFWYGAVRRYLESKNIPWTIWDYKGGFGLFKKDSYELFDYDLNIPLVDTLGFIAPGQKPYEITPDTLGFDFYTDYIGKNISFWSPESTTNLYDNSQPGSGIYSLYWHDAGQYSQIRFDFQPDRDLSKIVSDNFVLDFDIKCNSIPFKFDMRFIDTKKDSADHPWRMRITIDSTLVQFNGEWQHLHIPLKNFSEHGSWDNNTWYNPQGLFDWSEIDLFEIVAEHSGMGSAEIWFDDIKILNPETVGTSRIISLPDQFSLSQNYPNPFNPSTSIKYQLPSNEIVKLRVFNLLGQEIATLVNEKQSAGNYEAKFDGYGLASGIYIYRLSAGNFTSARKMLLLK